VGKPYIASLWLGSLALKRSRLKGVLHRSLALFCLLPSYFQASENWLTKGSKGPFVILVFEWGQCYRRHFVLYIMDPVQIIGNTHVQVTWQIVVSAQCLSTDCRSVYCRSVYCRSADCRRTIIFNRTTSYCFMFAKCFGMTCLSCNMLKKITLGNHKKHLKCKSNIFQVFWCGNQATNWTCWHCISENA